MLIGSSRRRLLRAGVTFRKRLEALRGAGARSSPTGATWTSGAVIWATGYRPDHSWIEVPEVTGRERSRPAPPRSDGRSRSVLRGSPVAVHPGIGAPGLHPCRCRLHRRDSHRVGGGGSGSAALRRQAAPRVADCPAARDLPATAMTHCLSTPSRPRNRLGREVGVSRPGRLGGRRRRPSGGVARRSSGGSTRRPSTRSVDGDRGDLRRLRRRRRQETGDRDRGRRRHGVRRHRAVAITGSPWLLVLGFVGHGLKDLWQHRRHSWTTPIGGRRSASWSTGSWPRRSSSRSSPASASISSARTPGAACGRPSAASTAPQNLLECSKTGRVGPQDCDVTHRTSTR